MKINEEVKSSVERICEIIDLCSWIRFHAPEKAVNVDFYTFSKTWTRKGKSEKSMGNYVLRLIFQGSCSLN